MPTESGLITLTATYDGETNFNGSVSAGVAQNVRISTNTNLVSSPNPAVLRNSVAFTATVDALLGSRPVRSVSGPSGTATFKDNGATIGTRSVVGGYAVFTTTVLAAGTHTVTVDYSGDTNYADSASSPVMQVISNPVPSITTINPTSSLVGGAGFTLTVNGTNFVNGSVV